MEKLIIKIKIPRADELQFACPVCSKSFASAKALGGHKRVHMQKGKKSSHQRRELRIADGDAGNVVKSFNCPVCALSFVSDKSLHGHMRAHPERNWRGMKPPTPAVENGGDSSLVPVSALLGNGSEGDHKELGSDVPLLEWPQSARRSRHGKAPMSVPADPDYDQELSVCGAYDLMALANGEPGRRDFAPKKKRLELAAVSTGAGSSGDSSRNKKAIVLGGDKNREKIINPGLESSARGKAIVLGGGLYVGNRDKFPNPGPESSTRREGSSSVTSNVNVRNKVAIKAPKQYICSICDRSFRSYHALGGHKAHHIIKDTKVRYSVGIDNESTTAGPVVPYIGHPQGCSRDVVHHCPFCDKVFSTSRALIDHRRQCSGSAEPVNEVLHPGDEEKRNQSIVVYKFDLNELPPEWTDADY